MVDVSPIAFALRTSSQSCNAPVTLSRAQQLIAAALGYNTLAAFQASPLESGLKAPAHIVLDGDRLARRAQELSLPHSPDELMKLVTAAFRERLPQVRVHRALEDLRDDINEFVRERVTDHEYVLIAMADTNTDGVRDVYFPGDELDRAEWPPSADMLTIELQGKVTLDIDPERPYCGHVINVRVALRLDRTGRASIAEPVFEIVHADVDGDWDDDYDGDGHRAPKMTFAEALAKELGIDVGDTAELVDVGPTVNASEDGLVYNYIFDFTDCASPAVARKILDKHGSLLVSVPAWFFDQVTPFAVG